MAQVNRGLKWLNLAPLLSELGYPHTGDNDER